MTSNATIEDRFFVIQDKTLEEQGLVQCFIAVDELISGIQSDASSFVALAKEDRSKLRKDIVERHRREHGLRSNVDTSKRVLFLRIENGRPRLTWHVAWFSKRGSGARFSSLKSTKTGTALRDVLEGAHPDEIGLLTSHEMAVRYINERWQHIARIRRSVRMCARVYLTSREKAARAGQAAE